MRVDDMDHRGLWELDPDGGVIRFAGQWAILLDAMAMRLLRNIALNKRRTS
jgi:two-component system, NtrC family, response regulator HydG